MTSIRNPALHPFRHQFLQPFLKDKKSYIKRIKQSKSLERFCLEGIQLKGANLAGANMKKVNLHDANLEGADLTNANLEKANLTGANFQRTVFAYANLYNADLWRANLREAKLWNSNLKGASLKEACVQEARLREANLEGANLLRANFHRASLIGTNLKDANLYQTDLRGADLWVAETGDNLPQEKEKDFLKAKQIYRTLKETCNQAGFYTEAGEYLYREMNCQRMVYRYFHKFFKSERPKSKFKNWKRIFDLKYLLQTSKWVLKYNLKYLWSWVVYMICGYGERPLNVFGTAGVIVLLFSILYILTPLLSSLAGVYDNEILLKINLSGPFGENVKTFFNSVYFSTITFVTVGYGDLVPIGIARLFAMLESFIGAFMIAVFVLTFGRKMLR